MANFIWAQNSWKRITNNFCGNEFLIQFSENPENSHTIAFQWPATGWRVWGWKLPSHWIAIPQTFAHTFWPKIVLSDGSSNSVLVVVVGDYMKVVVRPDPNDSAVAWRNELFWMTTSSTHFCGSPSTPCRSLRIDTFSSSARHLRSFANGLPNKYRGWHSWLTNWKQHSFHMTTLIPFFYKFSGCT